MFSFCSLFVSEASILGAVEKFLFAGVLDETEVGVEDPWLILGVLIWGFLGIGNFILV